ncbi:MAG TPA: alpha/beta fold hydrolase [Acetobacteraceae bacterium]|jgi:3-oxoadipate enol-lactonase|nr:alpha/beta fold hydrolase [Acetobacteraceae bacterium]
MNWIEVNGTSLRCELSGSGTATLVLVHEMGGTLESWDGVMGTLTSTRRVLRFDTRGAGLSAKLGGPVTWSEMADDIAALLDAHGIAGSVALAGTAVGAGIAMHFAVRHAARTGALVVSSPALGVSGDGRQRTLDRAAAVEAGGMFGLVESSLANSYPPAVRHNAEEFRKFRARWLCNDPRSFASISRMLAAEDLGAEVTRIACPTLVIGCTHDGLRPPGLVQEVAKTVPGAEYLQINSGHFAAVQTPGLMAQAIHQFLCSVGY